MPFDSTFLESFSNLKEEVGSLCKGFNELLHDTYHMAGHMDSNKEGVTYFWGFANRYDAREKRRMQ